MDKSDEYDNMEKYYISKLEEGELEYRAVEVKIESLTKKLGSVEYLEKELADSHAKVNEIIHDANQNIEQQTDHIRKLEDIISDKNNEIENLKKDLNDNAHLIEDDQVQTKQMCNEILDYKTRISDLEDELGRYKRMSHAGPMQDQTNFNFQIQKMEQINQNKLNSLHQQIDEWKNKFRDEKSKSSQLEEKLKYHQAEPDTIDGMLGLERGDSSKYTELTSQIKYLFAIEEDENILKRLDSIRKDIGAVELLRDELDKTKQLN